MKTEEEKHALRGKDGSHFRGVDFDMPLGHPSVHAPINHLICDTQVVWTRDMALEPTAQGWQEVNKEDDAHIRQDDS